MSKSNLRSIKNKLDSWWTNSQNHVLPYQNKKQKTLKFSATEIQTLSQKNQEFLKNSLIAIEQNVREISWNTAMKNNQLLSLTSQYKSYRLLQNWKTPQVLNLIQT